MISARNLPPGAVERGVRFIQIYSGGNHNDANWTRTHRQNQLSRRQYGQAYCGLLQDLEQRGY